jgi:hypothetical protein
MSRGLGFLEFELLGYLRRRGRPVCFEQVFSYSLIYERVGNDTNYDGRRASVKRSLNTLSKKGLVEIEIHNGVYIYTCKKEP